MLADDGDRYPRTFVIGLEFSGEIERTAFEEVLAETLRYEPRLSALVTRRGFSGPCWLPSDRRATVEWLPRAQLPDSVAARRIDLRRETGLLVLAVPTDTGVRISHVFHHACCDGLGALAFLGRLYAGYSRKVRPGTNVESTPANVDAIRNCRPADDLPERIGSRSEARRASWRRVREVLTTRPARLHPDGETCRVEPSLVFPGSLTHVLDDRQTRQLKRTARQHAATLNDLLLAAMFRSLRTWNTARDATRRHEPYQIMAPVDLRSPQHDDLPAANLVSCFFVKQSGAACDNPDELLRSVAARTQYAVQSRSGLIMYNAIRRLSRVPGLLNLVLKAWRTQATAMVSYVGDAGRAMQTCFPKRRGRCLVGNLELKQITATGLVRPGTAANLTAGTYAGELVLNLTLDPHQFSNTDAQLFLSMFVEHLLDYSRNATVKRTIEAVIPCG